MGNGYELQVDAKVLAASVLTRHTPTLAVKRDFAVHGIVLLRDEVVLRVMCFGDVATHAVRAVVKHGCPAESAAVLKSLKLLTKHRELPIRGGQLSELTCCSCGYCHFYTAVPTTVMQGCYRSVLKH
eukprot:810640-Amphidinium_carterae.3